MKDWRQKYSDLLKTPPAADTVLKPMEGKLGLIHISLISGQEPFLFAKAIVTSTVGVEPKWVIAHQKSVSGMKIVFTERNRSKILTKFGLDKDFIEVEAIKVIKIAESKNSLIGEVCFSQT